jgi:hypothetical protein
MPGEHSQVAPYEITLDEERRIAELRLGARMSLAQHTGARRELLALCRKTGIRRILVDASDACEPGSPAGELHAPIA